jgi:hypothetical protein
MLPGMGEAKNRDPGGRKFHMFKREQFLLLMRVLNTPSKDREQRRKRKHMWEELGLWKAARLAVKLGPRDPKPDDRPPLDAFDWADDEKPIPVRISGGTMDAMIDELKGDLQGPNEVHLGELEDRLYALRDGNYHPPDGLFPDPVPAESGTPVPT